MKDQNLSQLFESDLLNEETKTVLKEAFDSAIKAKEAELETDYAGKLTEAKKELSTSAMSMIEEAVADELSAIADEVAEARSLEIKYAGKLQEFKESYDEKMQEQITTLVNETVSEELDELKEDIELAKKHQFVMDMFESYKDVYAKTFGETDLNVHAELEEAQKELAGLKREKVLEGLLENVTGSKREVAMTILENVATDKLEAKFEHIRPILLAEEETTEEPVVESTTEDKDDKVKGKVVMENEEVIEEDEKTPVADDPVAAQLQRSLQFAFGSRSGRRK